MMSECTSFGYHRQVVFSKLLKAYTILFDRKREKLEVLVTIRAAGTALLSVDVMKSSKLQNAASS